VDRFGLLAPDALNGRYLCCSSSLSGIFIVILKMFTYLIF
jgi:hypothetical protein